MTPAPAIAVRDLQVRLRPPRRPGAAPAAILRGLSFTAPAGQVTAIVGANGAGKTTALRTIIGAVPAAAGSIEVMGRVMGPADVPLPEGVAVVADASPYPDHWTAHDVARLHQACVPRFSVRRLGAELRAHEVDLDTRIRDLSRGQVTQLLVAAALASAPQLLILDEPLARLDPLAREELVDRLRTQLATEDTTIVLTTHDLDGMDRFVDHLVVIAGGRCVLEGAVEDLRDELVLVELPGLLPSGLALQGAERIGDLTRGLLPADDAAGLPPAARLLRPGLTDLVTGALRHARGTDRTDR
ncbi:ATP-binding cassette domain-containing protein [Brachybacterium hainanense]|uniref:ATP-binding cassette domain-containing protein n=1 Tax=Brachybacterium hainanense TaxID=1541174 RepID=A0ABV6RG26_9MICO